MHIRLRLRSQPLPVDLEDFVERRARFALARFTPLLGEVRVTLDDVNGPRGGVDKRCKVRLARSQGEPIVSTALHESEHGAVAEAIERARRALLRARERELMTTRRPRFAWQ